MTQGTFESYFKSHDHHRLYYQVFKPQKTKGVLLFVHGLNEHSGRYSNPVHYFIKKGFTIYLFDHRGHGKSDGQRSYVNDFEAYLKDLDEFTLFVCQKEKKKKIFMVGHSLGGQIVLNYLAKYENSLSGFITSSANIEVAMPISWVKKFLVLHLSRFFPTLSLAHSIDPHWISRDLSVVMAYKKDPLVSKNITVKLASEIIRNQEGIMRLASKIRIPALMMHAGDDRICSPRGSEHFFEKLTSKDKTLIIYDKFYHELFNEFGKEKVFRDMEAWIKKHL